MKSKLAVLAVSLFFVNIISVQAFGQVEITNIQTIPTQVHVGKSFRINATIINNSPNEISFNGGCQSPISATFEKNIVIGQAIGCLAITSVQIKPGQKITVSGPSTTSIYTANSSGTTNANITFSYQTENNSKTVSKTFVINILDGVAAPEFSLFVSLILAIASLSGILVMFFIRNHTLFKF